MSKNASYLQGVDRSYEALLQIERAIQAGRGLDAEQLRALKDDVAKIKTNVASLYMLMPMMMDMSMLGMKLEQSRKIPEGSGQPVHLAALKFFMDQYGLGMSPQGRRPQLQESPAQSESAPVTGMSLASGGSLR